MNKTSYVRVSGRLLSGIIGVATAAYGAYVAVTWYRYGTARPAPSGQQDALLDRFMPSYEIVERHHVRVAAPAALTLAAASEMDLQGSRVVRSIIRAREVILRATPDKRVRPPSVAAQPDKPQGLLAEVKALGWSVLAEVPDREVVVGAVTRPWEANVTFRALPPDQFASFNEPGYVKIAWTIRAEPVSTTESLFLTETRAIATDAVARIRFRRYWSLVSPGIIMIRWAVLGPVKTEAERRARAHGSTVSAVPQHDSLKPM